MAIGLTRFGLKVATAPQTRSAIPRFELERRGLDPRRTLAGGCGERPLSRGEPGNGLATRGLSRIDRKALARSYGGALGACHRSPAGDAGGAASLRVLGGSYRMAAADHWRQPPADGVRSVSAPGPAASARAGT